jgi:dynein heavy chain
MKWPAEALYHVAIENLEIITENEDLTKSLSRLCAIIHESVESASLEMKNETGNNCNVTSSSYLEFIMKYDSLLKKKIEEITFKKDRISNGLVKLLETNEAIKTMEQDLKKFVPIIEQKTSSLKELASRLEKDNTQAELAKKAVSEQEAEGKVRKFLYRCSK